MRWPVDAAAIRLDSDHWRVLPATLRDAVTEGRLRLCIALTPSRREGFEVSLGIGRSAPTLLWIRGLDGVRELAEKLSIVLGCSSAAIESAMRPTYGTGQSGVADPRLPDALRHAYELLISRDARTNVKQAVAWSGLSRRRLERLHARLGLPAPAQYLKMMSATELSAPTLESVDTTHAKE